MEKDNLIFDFIKLSKIESAYKEELNTIKKNMKVPLEKSYNKIFYKYYKISIFVFLFNFIISAIDVFLFDGHLMLNYIKRFNFYYTFFLAYTTFSFLFISYLYKYLFEIKEFYDYTTRRVQLIHLFILLSTASIAIFSMFWGRFFQLELYFSTLGTSPLIASFLMITSYNREKHIKTHTQLNIAKKSEAGRKKIALIEKIIKDKNRIINKIFKERIDSHFILEFYNTNKLTYEEKLVIKRLFRKISQYEKNESVKIQLLGSVV